MRPDSFILFVVASLIPASALAAGVDLRTFKTHSRFTFAVGSEVKPEWRDTKGGFELLLRGVELSDLGAGAEDTSELRDPRVKSVQIRSSDQGVRLSGQWNFPGGDQAPADPSMERFQFREKEPNRLVIDFWPKPGPTVGDLKALKVKRTRDQAVAQAKAAAEARRKRREALEKQMALQEDVSRFCREPMKEGVEIFLPFYPYHEVPDFAAALPQGTPDQGYPYVIPDGDDAGSSSKYVRLAHELFKKEDYALAIKTIEFFEKEEPRGTYSADMAFLKANAFMKLGHKDAALARLEEIRTGFLGSPASLYAGMYLANLKRVDGNHLQSLESYMWLAQHYPEHRLAWVFRLVAAEELFALKQTDRAAGEYEWVTEHAPSRGFKAKGAFRIGDAFLNRFQYDRALAAYFKAFGDFPSEAKAFPSAYLGRAESLYWVGQLGKAEEAFRDFLKKYPSHPAGWRATLRLAEIVGRRSGEAASASSRQFFLDTINHYPFSAGATVARLRLLPCGDHGGMDAATAREFFSKQVAEFNGGGEIQMDRFKELRAMTRVRTLILLGDLVAAVDAAIEEREAMPERSVAGQWLGQMERQLFRKVVITLLGENRKFDAVKFYDERQERVDLEDDADAEVAMSPDYLLDLSRAASDLGLGRLATKIAGMYEDSAGRFDVARGIATGSQGASADPDERLRRSDKAFTEAKAAWVASLTAKPDTKKTSAIQQQLESVIEESPFSYQKQIILGELDERAGRHASALAHAARARLLADKKGPYELARIDQWIAGLQAKAGNSRSAIDLYRKLAARELVPSADAAGELGLPEVESREKLMLTEADLLSKQSRWGEAAQAFARAVEAGAQGNRALYEYSQALSKSARRMPAGSATRAKVNYKVQEILKRVADSEVDDFWRQLARKAIAGETAKEGKKQ